MTTFAMLFICAFAFYCLGKKEGAKEERQKIKFRIGGLL